MQAVDTVDLRVTRTVHNADARVSLFDFNSDSGLETEETCAECSLAGNSSYPARLHSNCVHIPPFELAASSNGAPVPLPQPFQSPIQSILHARHHNHSHSVVPERRSCPCCSVLHSAVQIDSNLIESARIGYEVRLENPLRAFLTPPSDIVRHHTDGRRGPAASASPELLLRAHAGRRPYPSDHSRTSSADQTDGASPDAAVAETISGGGSSAVRGGASAFVGESAMTSRDRGASHNPTRIDLLRKCFSNDLELSHEREVVRSEPLEISRIRRMLLTQVLYEYSLIYCTFFATDFLLHCVSCFFCRNWQM